MATKKKKEEKKETRAPFEIANELESTRITIAELKAIDVKLTAEFKEALHARQITEAGNYQISIKRTLKVKDEKLAVTWAQQNGALKIDTSKAKEILRHTFADPSEFGFAVVESESIIPKGGRADEE